MPFEGPKKLCKRAKFVADYFNMDPTVSIDWGSEDDFSECVAFEDGTFQIIISPWLKGDQLIEVIAHEMVHVWQYVSGRLVALYDVEKYIWLERTTYIHTEDFEQYLLYPWEQEARGYEAFFQWKWRHRCRTQKN